ncbi:hypothetical protein [Kribbella sp. NPDC051770]|uniref:hypothetical protein n=1 Tax=Kribbella sp. NPDC051770 TaxID=3155413 RepID=UPI0034344A58
MLANVDRIQRAATRGLIVGKYQLDDGWVPTLLLSSLADDRKVIDYLATGKLSRGDTGC